MSRPVNSTPREAGDDLREAVARQGSFMQTMKAVAWSFFGVRKSSDQQKDVTQLNPVHVVVAGVLSAVVFVVVLVMLVKWVIASGVAA
jgi:Protein of unknown function (DUF2970)